MWFFILNNTNESSVYSSKCPTFESHYDNKCVYNKIIPIKNYLGIHTCKKANNKSISQKNHHSKSIPVKKLIWDG